MILKKILLVISLALASAVAGASDEVDEQSLTTLLDYLRRVDSPTGILQLAPNNLELQRQAIVMVLRTALAALDHYSNDGAHTQDPANDLQSAPNKRAVTALLDAVNDRDCGVSSMKLMARVAERWQSKEHKETGMLAPVNDFCLWQLHSCWRTKFYPQIQTKLLVGVSKMSVHLFDFIDAISQRMQEKTDEEVRRLSAAKKAGDITIKEAQQQPAIPEDKYERARRLRQIALGPQATEGQTHEFILALNQLYASQRGTRQKSRLADVQVELNNWLEGQLVGGCRKLIERVKAATEGAEIFRSFPDLRLGVTLMSAAKSNPDLDYYLGAFRVCNLVLRNEEEIRVRLESMR